MLGCMRISLNDVGLYASTDARMLSPDVGLYATMRSSLNDVGLYAHFSERCGVVFVIPNKPNAHLELVMHVGLQTLQQYQCAARRGQWRLGGKEGERLEAFGVA